MFLKWDVEHTRSTMYLLQSCDIGSFAGLQSHIDNCWDSLDAVSLFGLRNIHTVQIVLLGFDSSTFWLGNFDVEYTFTSQLFALLDVLAV